MECGPFKLLSKLILQRVKEKIDTALPDTQFGFRRNRSTTDAVELLLKDIHQAHKERKRFYAVFIDFTKAFDYMDRGWLKTQLDKTLGKSCAWKRLLEETLSYNYVKITDNLVSSEPILQTNGVLQGDPMSPLLFNLAAADMLKIVDEARTEVSTYAYADDLVVGTTHLENLQEILDLITKWCEEHHFQINTDKTEMMIFRRGGRPTVKENAYINGRKIQLVSEFKYLGITLQPTGTCFTKHVLQKATQAMRAISDVKFIRTLALDTAMKLFRAKIIPILAYGLELIWRHLSENNLAILEKVKATYLKRALGVAKTTRSRLTYVLAKQSFLIEDLRTELLLPSTEAYKSLISKLNWKRQEIWPEFFGTGAMIDRTWTGPNFEKRHVFTRLAIHGFHHMLCKSKSYHDPVDTCICELCDKKCERYHIEICKNRRISVCDYANQNTRL